MSSTANVTVGKPKIGGAVFVAPVGTALPADTTTALNTAFKTLGYISEDGLVNSNSPETENVKAWGGDTILTPLTAKEDTFKFTLVEALNEEVLKLIYGSANVTGTLSTGITIEAKAEDAEAHAFVVEVVLHDAVKRICIKKATITDIGDITYADESPVAYEVTITALPDADGNTHYEYIKG